MSRRLLGRIRGAIVNGDYDLTRHAIDEMAEDGLGIFDVECAILDGELLLSRSCRIARSGSRVVQKW